MNNFTQRLVFSAIGILVVISMIINHWLSKELVTPVKAAPAFVSEEPPVIVESVSVEQKDYDPFSDYAPVPQGQGLQKETFVTKPPERIPSGKIIYEMPTSNKILLQ
jgi:hypothetical protein